MTGAFVTQDPAALVQRFQHMPVTHLGRSIAFYERLGLTLIVRAEDRYARFELPFGCSRTSSQALVAEGPP